MSRLRTSPKVTCVFRAAAIFAVGPLVAFAQTRDVEEFAASTALVQLDVVVLDRNGQPVTQLGADDFDITEDGQGQAIARFEQITIETQTPAAADPPSSTSRPRRFTPQQTRHLILFFDDYHLSPVTAERLRTRIVPYLVAALNEQDWVTIVAPGSAIWWTSRSSQEHQQIIPGALARLKGQLIRYPFPGGVTEWRAMYQVENEFDDRYSGLNDSRGDLGIPGADGRSGKSAHQLAKPKADETYAVARDRLVRTLHSADEVLDRLDGLRGRKTLVLFSEGFIHPPRLPEFARLIDHARHANVAIEFVNPAGLDPGGTDASGQGQTLLDSVQRNALRCWRCRRPLAVLPSWRNPRVGAPRSPTISRRRSRP